LGKWHVLSLYVVVVVVVGGGGGGGGGGGSSGGGGVIVVVFVCLRPLCVLSRNSSASIVCTYLSRRIKYINMLAVSADFLHNLPTTAVKTDRALDDSSTVRGAVPSPAVLLEMGEKQANNETTRTNEPNSFL
jgi:hypothetical protein